MRMIDKAGGELGKTIAHPLQSKVDEILYLNLGDREDWEVGSVIHFKEFNQIRNKIYVKQRLEELGFTLCPNNTDYKLTGIKGYGKPKHSAPRVKSKLELASITLKQSDLRLRIVEGLLRSGKPINSSQITKDGKKRLKLLIFRLRNNEKLEIESLWIQDGDTGFTIYALDEVYLELVGGKIKSRLKDITAYLERHGEISAKKTGLQSRRLNAHILALRRKGYQIETVSPGHNELATYKLISRP